MQGGFETDIRIDNVFAAEGSRMRGSQVNCVTVTCRSEKYTALYIDRFR